MLPIRTIVHPTDFSANSQCAWEMACALARDYGARLLLVHVEPPLPSFAELGAVPPEPFDRRALERKLAQIKPTDSHVPVVARTLLIGDETSEINRFAEENHADLIVMGTHGRTGLGRLLMGSVAESVLRQAPCPVLTIKTPLTLQTKTPMVCELAASI
jgi:nucleotide-binding universal stress UspA family protein